MAQLPFMIEVEHPPWLIDQHFGVGSTPGMIDIVPGPPYHIISQYFSRPWRHVAAAGKDLYSIKNDKDKFQVNLDVQHFESDEISVKIADGYIIVEEDHEEKRDEHGYITRQFTRRYVLPEDCTPETVESRLSSDGVLTMTAPRKVPQAIQGERQVTINETGPVRMEVKYHQA